MSIYHTVLQGEHIAGIAKKYGLSSYRTLWDHGENAQLRNERRNPNVLFPGDRVFVPDKGVREEARETDRRHRFVLKTETLRLRLVLADLYERPISHAKCELQIERDGGEVTTDGHGKIEREIDTADRQASLVIRDRQTPLNGIRISIRIGDLDPETKESGQKARLNNLGYFAGPVEGKSEEENRAAFLSAVEEFQCDEGLLVDGKCGPVTQSKLKHVHGC